MITIGTRGSELALWQANYTKELLEKQGHEVQIKIIATKGDASQQWNTSFDKLEGKAQIRMVDVTGKLVYANVVNATTGSVIIDLQNMVIQLLYIHG